MANDKDPIESCPRCQRGVLGILTGDQDVIYWTFKCPSENCLKWVTSVHPVERAAMVKRLLLIKVEEKS